jgi:hypothetical protein
MENISLLLAEIFLINHLGISKITATNSQIFENLFLIFESVAKKSKQSFEELNLKEIKKHLLSSVK